MTLAVIALLVKRKDGSEGYTPWASCHGNLRDSRDEKSFVPSQGLIDPIYFSVQKLVGNGRFCGNKKRQKSKPRDTETILVAIKTQRCTYFRRLSFTKLIDVLVLSINWTNAGCQVSLLILSAGTRLDRTFPFIDIKFKIWHFGPYVT